MLPSVDADSTGKATSLERNRAVSSPSQAPNISPSVSIPVYKIW